MRRLLLNLRIFLNYLFYGMKAADDVVLGNGKSPSDGGVSVEAKKEDETHKVIHDLLRGEITEEVRELRHEMYYAERESYNYKYTGGGTAKKVDRSLFGYKGNVENSDGLHVMLVQENKVDGGGVHSDMNLNKVHDDFTATFEREFIPTVRLEEYLKLIVLREIDDESISLDLYFSNYTLQYDRRSRIFRNKMDEILNGDGRSELLDFKSLSFTTMNAYGSDDNVEYKVDKGVFTEAFIHDGSIVLRFKTARPSIRDILLDIYDEKTDEKNKRHEERKGYVKTASFVDGMNRDEFDYDAAEELLRDM